jgi:hypothetical protein
VSRFVVVTSLAAALTADRRQIHVGKGLDDLCRSAQKPYA